MPMKEQVVTNGASVVLAVGPCHAIIKNKTGTVPVFLAMGAPKLQAALGGSTVTHPTAIDNGTCYQWDTADGPIGMDLPGGCELAAIVQAAGASQTIHVLSDR